METDRSADFWTLQTALAYGGGFYRRLAEAGLLADPVNRAKIFETWPDLNRIYGPDTLQHRQLRQR
jgi:hypothetical protein